MSAVLMLAPDRAVEETVVWQTEVPSGQVVTMRRGGQYTSRIMQNSCLDGWDDSTSSLRRAKILHDGFVAMARGAEVYEG